MKKDFLIEKNGRTFVLYAGLLDEAHERGLKAITTTLIQVPSDLNGSTAIVHASVELEKGSFTGLGDAAPDNVSRMMVPHLIRMAETRAKARALRDAVNVGVTALEELGEFDASDREGPADPAAAPIGGGRRVTVPRAFEDSDERPAARGLPAGTMRGSDTPHPGVAPATPKQLQTIQRMARAAGRDIAVPPNMTRAAASEIISSLIGEMEQRQDGQ